MLSRLSHRHCGPICSVSWELSHWDSQGAQAGNAGKGECHCKRAFETHHVRLENPRKLSRWENSTQLRGTCCDHKARVHAWGLCGQRNDEPVDKCRLSCRGTECTSDRLEDWSQNVVSRFHTRRKRAERSMEFLTKKASCDSVDVFGFRVRLHDAQAMHNGKGYGSPDEELVANPLAL